MYAGTTLSGQGLTSFYSHSIKMEFHGSTPKTFKPGLSFVARVNLYLFLLFYIYNCLFVGTCYNTG